MFLDALRRHLELTRQGLLSTRRFPTWMDDARREAKVFEIAEIEERGLGSDDARRGFVEELSKWGGEFNRTLIECLLSENSASSFLAGFPGGQEAVLTRAVVHVLRSQVANYPEAPNLGIRLRRFAAGVSRAYAAARAERARLGRFSIYKYADELRLVRTSGGETHLRPAGEILLSLRGRDVLRWLLALEVSSALGETDRWRLGPERARAFAEERHARWDPMAAPTPWPWDGDTLRWELSGLLDVKEDEESGVLDCKVTQVGAELFGELDQSSGEALRSLARATLADETHEALHGRRPAVSEAAELGRHTRMVAHELRNILVPVQLSLKHLRRAGGGDAFMTENGGALDNIANGLERALRFATETARVTSQGLSRDDLFAVEAAVRDAIAGVQSDLRHPVEFEAASGVERVYLRARRERFVLAVLNLLRNANQAGGAEVRIFVHAEMAGGTPARLVILVEDDGPGVPAEQQASIFHDGVSFRAGGSGHGLALVREVVEGELRGSIHCEPSPRGGARFVLRLPIPLEGVT